MMTGGPTPFREVSEEHAANVTASSRRRHMAIESACSPGALQVWALYNQRMVWTRFSLLLCTALACTGTTQEVETTRSNLLLIVIDDLGYGDLGCTGSTEVATPNFDRLAAEGVQCTQAYATSSLCSPSRAALLVGRYQQRFGHEHNTGDIFRQAKFGIGLPIGQRTLADDLAQVGYATAAIGKWHLGVGEEFHPLRRGFQRFFGHLGGGHPYTVWDDPETGPILDGETPVAGSTYLTEAFTDEAVRFIEESRREPFFLYLSYNAPHAPLEAPAPYLEQIGEFEDGERRIYLAMVAALDAGIGRVLDALDKSDLAEETLVVLVNDNGAPRSHGINRPFRGHKQSHYEGGIRVPLFVRWPGRLPAGSTFAGLVSTLDIAPTMRAAAGIEEEVPTDGVDLRPYLCDLRGEEAAHTALFWRRGDRRAARVKDWKMVAQHKRVELYDLAQDPGEQHDLARDQPEQLAALEQAYAEWEAPMVSPLWEWVD